MTSTMEQQHQSILQSPIKHDLLWDEVFYRKENVAWFFRKLDPNWQFSNMAGGLPIRFDGFKWNSSEQLYQASKYANDIECVPASAKTDRGKIANVRKRIMNQRAARGAKMTQKCAVKAGLVRRDWDDPQWEVRIHSMYWVLEKKLAEHPKEFGYVLGSTASRPIVEISSKDRFWGCTDSNGTLRGCNVLGKLLELLRKNSEDILSGKLIYPDGFLLS